MADHDPRSDDDLPLPARTSAETALDVTAAVVGLAPVLGGPVASVLSGLSGDRRFQRVREVVLELAQRVQDLSEEQKNYIRSEDFEDLLHETLERVWRERNEEKRRIYREFLEGAIQSPGQPYDEQLRFLRTLEELQPDHLRILRAMIAEPGESPFIGGSRFHTLQQRLPDIEEPRLRDLVAQLEDMRLTTGPLGGMVTGPSAADLRPVVTEYGQRFVRFLRGEP